MNIVTINKIIQQLKLVASDVAPVSRARLAAAVVYKNKIISIGINQDKTHPWAVKFQKNEHATSLHAEVDAIKKASYRLSEHELAKSTLIVVRVRTTNEQFPVKDREVFGIAKPCDGCQSCIDAHKINRVVYTDYCEYEHEVKYTIWEK